jgi:phosphodiesterase/alkaline phosphatase D-like protein
MVTLQVPFAAAAPEQVHLSVTERPDEMVVWWITEDEPPRSEVRYGTDERQLDKLATSSSVERYRYKGTRMRGGYTSGYINEVVLKDLELGDLQQTYFYKCGDDRNGWSEVFSFRTRPEHPDAPVTFVAHGDQDAGQDDTSRTKEVLEYMVRYHEQSPTDLYLHVGDHSYADGNQHEWDYYGRVMQEYASLVPIVAAVGNREYPH